MVLLVQSLAQFREDVVALSTHWSIRFERKSQGKGKVEVVLYSRIGE